MFNIDSNTIQIKSRKLLPEIQVKYLCEKVITIIKINIKKKFIVKRNIPKRKYNNINNPTNNISR